MTRSIWVAAALALAASEAHAQLYLGSEIGLAVAPALRLVGTDNDWGTRCDLLINPAGLETGVECDVPPPPTEWTNESGRATGVATGIVAGYRFGRYRAEIEYRYRASRHHDYTPTQIGDVVTVQKADQELETAIGGAGDLTVHGVFSNVAFDLLPVDRRVSSYIGVGGGLQRVSVDYYSLWEAQRRPGADSHVRGSRAPSEAGRHHDARGRSSRRLHAQRPDRGRTGVPGGGPPNDRQQITVRDWRGNLPERTASVGPAA